MFLFSLIFKIFELAVGGRKVENEGNGIKSMSVSVADFNRGQPCFFSPLFPSLLFQHPFFLVLQFPHLTFSLLLSCLENVDE